MCTLKCVVVNLFAKYQSAVPKRNGGVAINALRMPDCIETTGADGLIALKPKNGRSIPSISTS